MAQRGMGSPGRPPTAWPRPLPQRVPCRGSRWPEPMSVKWTSCHQPGAAPPVKAAPEKARRLRATACEGSLPPEEWARPVQSTRPQSQTPHGAAATTPLPLPPRGPHVLEEQPPSTHTGLHVPTCQGVSYLWPWKPGPGTGSSHRLPAPGRSPCHPHLSRPAGPSLAPVPRLPSLPTAQGLRLRDAGWAGFSHRGCSSGETEGQRCDAVAEGGVTPSGDR